MTTKNKLPRITFTIDQLPGCCGIGVICHLEDEQGGWASWNATRRSPVKKPFSSPEEQAKDFLERAVKDTWTGGFDDYSYLQMALVSNYANGKAPQYPAVQDLLVMEGWTINMVFINPNHGNEVTVYSKYFPERDKLIEDEEEDEAVPF